MKKKLFSLVLAFFVLATLLSSSAQAFIVCGPGGGTCKPENEYCPPGTGSVQDPSCPGSLQACCPGAAYGHGVIKPPRQFTNDNFDALNPLKIAGGDSIEVSEESEFADQLSTPGGIVTRVLVFIFPLAGLILFLMISWGGFEILTGGGDSAKVTAGKQRLTAAIVGFLILFASYWMVQIMEVVFGVVIF